jgi:hypothetical protein
LVIVETPEVERSSGGRGRVGRQAAAIFLTNIAAFRDADQSVMRLEIVFGREIALVGGDEREVVGIGQFDQRGFHGPLARQPVALQLDVEPVGIDGREPLQQVLRAGLVALAQRGVDRAFRPARERDQPLAVGFQIGKRDERLMVLAVVEISRARQLHEALVASLILGDQRDRAVRPRRGVRARGAGLAELDGKRATDDGLDSGPGQRLGKLQRAEQVVAVSDRQCGLRVGGRQLGELLDRQRAFQQRVSRMHAQMNEAGSVIHRSSR